MTSRLAALAEAESVVLERMAVSRANLLDARKTALLHEIRSRPSLLRRVKELVSIAPNVTLLAAVLVGSLLIGPREIARVVVRNGLLAWIAKTVRRIAGS
ncbi:hypothetical protein [Paraburkholderia diazotrophica]|uniref:Uncharacterized protein n=1 Tax=Paraburkholderia diazotrophica TaxID=667676 RepID=A0A1H7EGX3_9BURK|nr:hypothetical protein [Paraburkholderia diazotrophica]SEK12864.1 hypothetical protein SAMN05192539_106124 [Paraburkholderia diazotrophica]